MIRKFIAAFMIIFFSATTAFAAEIDGNVIRVTGTGYPPSNWNQQDSFAKTFARQAARMDALRGLVATLEYKVNQLDIRSTFVMKDFELTEDKLVIRISQDSQAFKLLEKNTRQVGNASFSEDGACTVTMEIILPANWKDYFKK